MLVLTRHAGEKINIGDDIVISVVRLQGGRVKLGIEAPKDIPINRHDILNGNENPPFTPLAAPVCPMVAGQS